MTNKEMVPAIRVGAQFSYNGKRWRVTGFTREKVLFKATEGNLQSQLDHDMFLRIAEFPQASKDQDRASAGTEKP